MNNEDIVFSSEHKLHSHELINGILWSWIDINFHRQGRIITMPSRSGRQENTIISHIRKLEELKGNQTLLQLFTFDDKYEAHETGIISPHPSRLWKHLKCGDIFSALQRYHAIEMPTAAWFDLTGGLLNSRLIAIQQSIKSFSHGSLLFVTLAIKNARGLTSQHYAKAMYDLNSNESRADITNSMLVKIVEKLGNKYIVPCIKPYVYRNGKSTFGVFGYIIGAS